MASRRAANEGASAAGRHDDPAAAATSVSQARRNPSHSKVPCQIVPYVLPSRVPPGKFGSATTTPW